MPSIPDVLIVGGGAVGAASARALAAAGASVTLLERPDAAGEGWRASAGMLAAQIEARAEDPLLALALAGRAWFAEQVPALQRATGIDVALLGSGVLQLVHQAAEVPGLKERIAWQRQQALRADWLEADEVADGRPWLSRCLGGFWSPDDGSVDPQRLVAALRADATRLGARLVADTVTGLDSPSATLRGVIGTRQRYAGGTVVIAAGAWSARIAGLPRPLSVEPVRGQMLAFPWPTEAAAAVVYGEGCYVLRRGDEMLVGATVEHAGFDASVTADGLAGLQLRACRLVPSLSGAPSLRSWAGLRPGTPDGLPIIGAEPRLPGLWYATGHGRNGILLAGITGDLIARGIAGERVPDEMHAVRPTRFWEW